MKYQLKITRSFKIDYKKLNKQETQDTDEIIKKLLLNNIGFMPNI